MTYLRKHIKLVLVAAACVTIGAAGSAIATAGAAGTSPTSATGSAASATTPAKTAHARGLLARRAVQGAVVVATKNGFETVTLSRGFVQSVSGQQLTIREGTRKATYKTVTLTIPSSAVVRDNRQASTLSALTAGQRVSVAQGPKRTLVVARTLKTP
ncbi:MAG TPA: hypothetical protein VMB27_20430 [Solirubrobacteraceae bacterium]|nr:hypothetical protein [Solirubrobacteraceae bacterium]